MQMFPELRAHKAQFGAIVGYGFFINAVVGAGFLSIPYAYQRGGWVLALGLEVTAILLGLLLSYMTLEITSRVASINALRRQGVAIPSVSLRNLVSRTPILDPLLERRIPTPQLTQQYDVSHLVYVCLGRVWSYIYIAALCVVFLGSLVAYTSTFGTSFVSNVPLGRLSTCDVYDDPSFGGNCRWKYMVYVGVFGVGMVYFTFVGLKKQWWMQMIFTFMRFLVVALVVSCCAYAIASRTHLNNDQTFDPLMPPLADFSHLGSVFSILLFSCLYQTNIPSIAVHIHNKKRNLPLIMQAVTVTLLLVYVPLGLVASTAVPDLNSMVTLAFRHYTAGTASPHSWTYLVEYVVILFPALDVFSVFPIMAITLADNITALLYGRSSKDLGTRVLPKQRQLTVRMCVCVPPLLISLLEYDLGVILSWAGLCSFLVVPFILPLSLVAARKILPVADPYRVPCPDVRCKQWTALLLSGAFVPVFLAMVYFNIHSHV